MSGETTAGLLLLFFVVLAVIAFMKCGEWIGAKADEATQRARKLELENDKFEYEFEKLKATAEGD